MNLYQNLEFLCRYRETYKIHMERKDTKKAEINFKRKKNWNS